MRTECNTRHSVIAHYCSPSTACVGASVCRPRLESAAHPCHTGSLLFPQLLRILTSDGSCAMDHQTRRHRSAFACRRLPMFCDAVVLTLCRGPFCCCVQLGLAHITAIKSLLEMVENSPM